jgi:hypothetical protein
MKNAFWNLCEFCAAVAGLLVWVPRRDPAFEHVVRKFEDDCTSHRPSLY